MSNLGKLADKLGDAAHFERLDYINTPSDSPMSREAFLKSQIYEDIRKMIKDIIATQTDKDAYDVVG